MADFPIGEIPIIISGDYSALQDALQQAQQIASQSGGAIAEAFNQAAAAVKELDAGQLNLFNSALEGLQAQGLSASDALAQIAQSGNTLGDSVANAAGQLRDSLTPATHDAGHAAEEAKGSFEGFGEQLAHIAELVGVYTALHELVEVMKELVSESLDAYGRLEMVQVGMTALSGSAETTTEVLEKLEGIAKSTVFSFPDLAQAAQKMEVLGVEADKIPDVMTAVAHAAELTNNSLDGVANALDRVYLSATVQPRTLAQLGVSIADLAETMGVSIDQVTKAFKALGPQSDVALEALVETINRRTAEAGTAMEGTLNVSINALKTEWDALLVEFGKDIAPNVKDLLADISALLPYLEKTVALLASAASSQLGELIASFKILKDTVADLVSPLTSVVSALHIDWSGLAGDMVNYLTHWRDLATLATNAAAAIDVWRGKYPDIKTAIDSFNTSLNQQKAATDGVKHATDDEIAAMRAKIQAALSAADASSGLKKLDQEEAQALNALNEGYTQIAANLRALYKPTLMDVATEQQKVNDARAKALAANSELVSAEQYLKSVYDSAHPTVEKLQNAMLLLNAAKKDSQAADKELGEAEKQLAEAQKLQEQANIAQLDTQQKVDASTQKLNATFETFLMKMNVAELQGVWPLQKALATLGVTADGGLSKTNALLDALEVALRDSTNSTGEMIVSTGALEDAWRKVAASIKNMASDPEGMARVLKVEQELLDKLIARKAPIGDILDLQAAMLQQEITLDEKQGTDATAEIVRLTNIKEAQQLLIDKATLLGQTYQGLMKAFNDSFTQLSKGIADNIVDEKNWGDVFVGIGKNIAKEILEDLVGTAFKALKNAILENTGLMKEMGGIFTSIFGGGGSSVGVNNPLGGGGAASGSAGSAAGAVGSAVGGTVTGIIGAVGAIGSFIAGVIGDIQNMHIEKVLGQIETNTRYSELYLQSIESVTKASGDLWNTVTAYLTDTQRMLLTSIAGGILGIAVGGQSNSTAVAALVNSLNKIGADTLSNSTASITYLSEMLQLQRTSFAQITGMLASMQDSLHKIADPSIWQRILGNLFGGATAILGSVGSSLSSLAGGLGGGGLLGGLIPSHTDELLKSIELNTRLTAMFIGGLGSGGVQDWLKIIADNTTGGNEFFAGGGWFHDAIVSLMGTVEDIDSILHGASARPSASAVVSGVTLSGAVQGASAVVAAGPITFHIHGATDPRRVTDEIAKYMKSLSYKFSN